MTIDLRPEKKGLAQSSRRAQRVSEIEYRGDERGKKWVVVTPFKVTSREGQELSVPRGFRHDRYTFAPDLPDERPAVIHDRAYRVQMWDNGLQMTRSQADTLLFDLMALSEDATTRSKTSEYYRWVRRLGWSVWFYRMWKQ